jgi:flagellar FliL protein
MVAFGSSGSPFLGVILYHSFRPVLSMAKKEEAKPEAEAEKPEGEASAEGAEASQKGSKKKLFIIIGAVVVLLLGGGAGLYFSGILGKSHPPEGAEHAEEKKEEPKQIENFVYFDLPEIIVNLASGSRKNTFMKISVSLQIEKEDEKAQLEKVTPRIVDKFQVYLRGLQVEDLQGSSGMFRLREELLARVNVVTEPVKIHDVLFKEILIQ